MSKRQSRSKRHPCALCGRELQAERMIYSAYTHQRYCGIDLARCETKAHKRRRKALEQENRP